MKEDAMRYLQSAAVLAVLLIVAAAQAQETVEPKKAEGRKNTEYKKVLKDMNTWVSKLDNVEFYNEQFSFKNRETGKEKAFKEFEKLDQRMFMLTSAQKLSGHLGFLQDAWEKELKKAPATGDGKDDSVASKEEVQKYIDQIKEVRKAEVKKWEEMAQAVFKDFPDKFSKQEQEFYLKQVRALKAKIEGK
jgi:hypothetical protein